MFKSPPTLLFVCTGNTCRSPMAEVLAKSLFRELDIMAAVHSAGVNTDNGYPASSNAIIAMRRESLDLSSHKSQQLSYELLERATLILTMTQGHLHSVKSAAPHAYAFTLGQYANQDIDISDPYGGDLATYQRCARQIKQLLESSVAYFKEDLWTI